MSEDRKRIDIITYEHQPNVVSLSVWGVLRSREIDVLRIEGVKRLQLTNGVSEVVCTLNEGVGWESVKLGVLNKLCELLKWRDDEVDIHPLT